MEEIPIFLCGRVIALPKREVNQCFHALQHAITFVVRDTEWKKFPFLVRQSLHCRKESLAVGRPGRIFENLNFNSWKDWHRNVSIEFQFQWLINVFMIAACDNICCYRYRMEEIPIFSAAELALPQGLFGRWSAR